MLLLFLCCYFTNLWRIWPGKNKVLQCYTCNLHPNRSWQVVCTIDIEALQTHLQRWISAKLYYFFRIVFKVNNIILSFSWVTFNRVIPIRKRCWWTLCHWLIRWNGYAQAQINKNDAQNQVLVYYVIFDFTPAIIVIAFCWSGEYEVWFVCCIRHLRTHRIGSCIYNNQNTQLQRAYCSYSQDVQNRQCIFSL